MSSLHATAAIRVLEQLVSAAARAVERFVTAAIQSREQLRSDVEARRQADARGVPKNIMSSRIGLIGVVIFLIAGGLLMAFSASTVETLSQGGNLVELLLKQVLLVAVGVVCALIARVIPYRAWRVGPWFWIIWLVAFVLLIAVAWAGTEILGAQRWIYIGSFSLQPTEFVKIVLIIAATRIMCDLREELASWRRSLVMFAILVIMPLALLFATQSDMGSAFIIAMGIFAVAWLGEVPIKILVVAVAVAAVAAVVFMGTGYRLERIQVWLDPWNDGEGGYGTGFQLIHSFYAFAQGGILGVGLGYSREKYLYLPEAENDFIFSIIGEEAGMFGAVAVIVLFILFLLAGLRIAATAPDEFGKVLAGSLTIMLVGQAFLNMACAIGLFPTTGKPLPFISAGGSSIISSFMVVGLLLSVSRYSNVLSDPEQRRNELNVLRAQPAAEAATKAQGESHAYSRRRARAARPSQDRGFGLIDMRAASEKGRCDTAATGERGLKRGAGASSGADARQPRRLGEPKLATSGERDKRDAAARRSVRGERTSGRSSRIASSTSSTSTRSRGSGRATKTATRGGLSLLFSSSSKGKGGTSTAEGRTSRASTREARKPRASTTKAGSGRAETRAATSRRTEARSATPQARPSRNEARATRSSTHETRSSRRRTRSSRPARSSRTDDSGR